jgi:hypothetical protein
MEDSIFLTKEMLLEQKDVLAIEKVELLDNKGNVRGHVYVREMTAKEKNTWEMSLTKRLPSLGTGKNKQVEQIVTNLEDYRAKLAICTICDENGNRQFEMNPKTIEALSSKLSASNMERIADIASKLNKITEADQEELVKNLDTDLNDSSSLGSV